FQVFESIEQSKRALSERDDTLFTYRYPTIDIEQPLRRAEFEVDSRGHVDAIVGTLHDTLDAASVTPADVDIVCCTGGTAKIPALDGALRTIFGDGKMNSLETFHSVILGLADEARRVARHPAA
ncbi:MAG: Hsp70 family protein, partial [Myxococcota bacterium]